MNIGSSLTPYKNTSSLYTINSYNAVSLKRISPNALGSKAASAKASVRISCEKVFSCITTSQPPANSKRLPSSAQPITYKISRKAVCKIRYHHTAKLKICSQRIHAATITTAANNPTPTTATDPTTADIERFFNGKNSPYSRSDRKSYALG